MISKIVIVLSFVCVVLALGLFVTIILLYQINVELQIKTNQVSELENEEGFLIAQVSSLQAQGSSLQDEVAVLETEKMS